jgi:hypothetical protein
LVALDGGVDHLISVLIFTVIRTSKTKQGGLEIMLLDLYSGGAQFEQ